MNQDTASPQASSSPRRRVQLRSLALVGSLVILAVGIFQIGPWLLGASWGEQYARDVMAPAFAQPYSPDWMTIIQRSSWFPSDEVVEQLNWVLESSEGGPVEDLEALTALARIGTPSALSLLERGRHQGEVPVSWWRPPKPPEPLRTAVLQSSALDLSTIGLPDEIARSGCRVDVSARDLGVQGETAEAPLDVGSWLLFEHSFYGNLWWVRVPDEGQPWPASYFAGPLVNFTSDPLECELVGRRLHVYGIEAPEEGAKPTRQLVGDYDLAQLDDDTDGDGLTDLYEAFLTTDPGLADSDQDGLQDGVDLAPLSGGQVEERWATSLRDLVEGFSPPPEEAHVVQFVKAPLGVEWRRAAGPTIRIPPEVERLGPRYTYKPMYGRPLTMLVKQPEELMAELEWRLSGSPPRFVTLGGCAGDIEFRMRRIGDRWYAAHSRWGWFGVPLR